MDTFMWYAGIYGGGAGQEFIWVGGGTRVEQSRVIAAHAWGAGRRAQGPA